MAAPQTPQIHLETDPLPLLQRRTVARHQDQAMFNPAKDTIHRYRGNAIPMRDPTTAPYRHIKL